MDLNEVEKQIYGLARPFLCVMNNDSHTRDMLDLALRLLSGEGGERDVVIPASILHDVGWSRVPEKLRLKARAPDRIIRLVRIHEVESVRIAENILAEVAGDSLPVAEILEIIDGHDTREEALSLNDKIVKDADKLSRYSIGFWDIIEWSGIDPRKLLRGLESRAEKWFYLPRSKEIAHEKIPQRWKEITGWRPRSSDSSSIV